MKLLLISFIALCSACNITFEQRTGGMKRPIILVGKSCSSIYSGAEYCSVILRDSTGRMVSLNTDTYAKTIALQYNVGDTLK